ncbi:STAS domain-containing protein [Methanobrevibacter sp. DSM 116169]|uniref:STAS domain-containing protein n=1 Tax=Methanobrevibacter sp. DSM 116169 TaxID=3242727 RepID=UPI0038FD0400
MEVIKNKENNQLNLKIIGRLDANTAPELEEEINNECESITLLVLDLEELMYISSAGLRTILASEKMMRQKGELQIKNVNSFVMEIFTATGFKDKLNIQ